MKTATALNHVQRLSARQREIYYGARLSGMPHRWILDQMAERIQGDPAFAKLPNWAKTILGERSSRGLSDLYNPCIYGKELDRMLDRARRGEAVPPIAYLRWAHFYGGKEITFDDCSAGNLWPNVESKFIWNHLPYRSF